MKISRFGLKPGSGHLVVKIEQDGPTKVVNISNIRDKSYLSINWEKIAKAESELKAANTLAKQQDIAYEFYINLTGGIGVSVIQWLNQEYEELLYAYLKLFEVNFEQTNHAQNFILKIQSIQVCNQLLNSSRQNLLLIPIPQQSSLSSSSSDEHMAKHHVKEALKIDFCRRFKLNENILTIEHLLVDLADVNFQLEEKLLWKIVQFLGIKYLPSAASGPAESELSQIEEKFRDLTTDEFSDAARKNETNSSSNLSDRFG